MNQRKLGRTGLQISELGFGAWSIGGNAYGPTCDSESLRALAYAVDHGVNFFDTADTYGHGHSEKLIGEIFQKSSKRDQAVIASKVGWDFYHGGDQKNFDSEYIRFACGESLKRLQTDYLDLYQLHNPKLELISEGRVFKTLEALKQEGKIRFWGVSIHVAREGAAVIQEGSSDAIQAVYNLIDQRICREMMPLCEEHEIGLIIREPLYSGFLSGKYTLASEFEKIDHRRRWTREKRESDFKKIRRIQTAFDESKVSLKQAAMEFVLSEKAVSVVIPGIKTVTQLEDHLRAVHEPKLSKTEIQQLKSIFNTEELFQTGFHRN